jgi:hypothetical protein
MNLGPKLKKVVLAALRHARSSERNLVKMYVAIADPSKPDPVDDKRRLKYQREAEASKRRIIEINRAIKIISAK